MLFLEQAINWLAAGMIEHTSPTKKPKKGHLRWMLHRSGISLWMGLGMDGIGYLSIQMKNASGTIRRTYCKWENLTRLLVNEIGESRWLYYNIL